MKLGILVAGLTGVTIGAPALAEAPIALHPTTQIAQALTPPFPPPVTVPVAPPNPQEEIPPPSPSPTYVWEPGHWSWNGMQYFWQPGKYLERPSAATTYVAGHWEQYPNGWIWVAGQWDNSGVGSSTPPWR